jgi:prepilin peptidase CpaA
MSVATIVLLAATCVAAAVDVRTRRIPNALTAATALLALAVHVPDGIVAVLIAFVTMILAFLAGSLAFSAGWFGGGDVKLIAACCGLIGGFAALSLVLDILVAGAVLALVTAAFRGRLGALVRSTVAIAAHGVPVEKSTLPYAVAIAAGSVVYALAPLVPVLRFPAS